MLVQKGAIGLILDLQSALVSQSTQAMTVVKEALINLAQLSARIMIRTNPAVIPSDQCEALSSLLCKQLLTDECHHELL